GPCAIRGRDHRLARGCHDAALRRRSILIVMGRSRMLVVFDLDDTLYLEVDFARSGFAAVEAELGIEGLAVTAWSLHALGVRGIVLREALRRHGRKGSRDEVARAVAIYRRHRPSIEVAPDARVALAALAADPGVELAVLTDGDAVTQRNKMYTLHLAR